MAKQKTKVRLPKRVAGIKIPKAVRKNSGWLVQLLQTPQVQAAVASGLAAASAALADEKGKMSAKEAKRRLKFATEEGVDRIAALADAVGAAVTTSLESWFHRPGDEKAGGRPGETPPAGPDRDRASTH